MSSLINRVCSRPYLRRGRLALVCFSIGANALTAGGIFCFPLISPALVTHLKLTQPQLTTIAVAGMMGQYPFAAFVGKVLDYYGPWACSLVAACFFSTGFGLFAREIAKTPDDITQPSTSSFHHLVLYFFMCALGTVFSYFSSLFAASKNFPQYIGVAAGTTLALFGLSPTFISILASRYFSSPDDGLDVTHFLQFLAILCGCVHLLGALTMQVIPPASEDAADAVLDDPEEPNERTGLLQNKTNGNDSRQAEVQVEVVPVIGEEAEAKQSALDVLKDRNFWALAFVSFVVLGSCEMIISNIGTIVLSLPIKPPPHDLLGNTITRLVVGPLADIVSPVKQLISRTAFLTFSSAVLVCAYTWMVVGVRDQGAVWALSIAAGVAYGCTFTVLPSLVSSVWGLSNSGRNFGLITYAPFLGTPVFSYLYAFIAAAHSPDADGGVEDGIEMCKGPQCWGLTFEVSAVAVARRLV
ncbi:MFS general substrate transporter [Melanogaster broomeanus]|nr:MFS general substrate transporter [Melanogaster broomeanus]